VSDRVKETLDELARNIAEVTTTMENTVITIDKITEGFVRDSFNADDIDDPIEQMQEYIDVLGVATMSTLAILKSVVVHLNAL
jgi:hypothetical protein